MSRLTWGDSELRELAERVLTARQFDCLRLVMGGMSEKDAGFALRLSRRTVREHFDRAAQKLQIAGDVVSAAREIGTDVCPSVEEVAAHLRMSPVSVMFSQSELEEEWKR